MRNLGRVLGLLSVSLVGCGGSQRYAMVAGSPPSGAQRYASAESAEAAPPASYDSGATPSPEVRPGLATEWGESRRSSVRQEHFVRASESPFATVAIRYNDAAGAASQAAYRQAAQGGTGVSYVGAYGDGIRVSIVDEHGNPLPGWIGGDTLYVMGQYGQRYEIVLTNTTPARFESVVTVDGLDVINGQPGSYANRGYLLEPYGTLRIEGFRQSASHVAAFRFGTVSDSYAAQTGDARNVGVIGVALFAEMGWVPQPVHTYGDEIQLREGADPFPGGYAPPPPRRRYPF
jgi:hypothetical protein